MKIYISKSMINAIRTEPCKIYGHLYGRLHPAQGVIQAISLSPVWRGFLLEHIGYWRTHREIDPWPQVPTKGMVFLKVCPDGVWSHYEGGTIPVVSYDESDYHSRHRNMLISQKLDGRCIMLVGMGTLGTKIGLELAKHGLFVIAVDPDEVSIENIYRMAFTLPPPFLVGLNKCHAFESVVRMILPQANVLSCPLDVSRQQAAICRIIEQKEPQLIIITTDTVQSVRDISSIARQYRIPVMRVSLSDGAESGQIHWMTGETDDPCLMCIIPDDEIPAGMRQGREQYAEVISQAQQAVPSLSTDTTMIAAPATKIAMAFLAGEDIQRYFTSNGCKGEVMWISTTPDTWIMEDFCQKIVARVEKNQDCTGCAAPDLQVIREKHKMRKEKDL